jgi:HEAT repeat protein
VPTTPVGQAELASAAHPQGAPMPVAYMSVLQRSSSLEQREWAAENLGQFDGATNPRVVDALALAARKDESPVVRLASLRSLAQMKVQTLPVITAVREALQDGDPRVRAEAEKILHQLGVKNTRTAAPTTRSRTPR